MKKILLIFASLFCFTVLMVINYRINENSKITPENLDGMAPQLDDMEKMMHVLPQPES